MNKNQPIDIFSYSYSPLVVINIFNGYKSQCTIESSELTIYKTGYKEILVPIITSSAYHKQLRSSTEHVYENGVVITRSYFQGKLDDILTADGLLPAIRSSDGNYFCHYELGVRHRPANQGPAARLVSYMGESLDYFYENGKLHNPNGPAITGMMHGKQVERFFVNGEEVKSLT
jgi:hypothetical protein